MQPDVGQAMESDFVSNCYEELMSARNAVDNAGCEELGGGDGSHISKLG